MRLATVGGLVRTIVPQAQVVAIFDRQAQIGWATDTAEHAELQTLAADLLGSAGADGAGPSHSMRCERDAAASYAFLMRDAAGTPTGVLTLVIPGPFSRADLVRPAALQARLAPILAEGARAEPAAIDRLITVLAARIEAGMVMACVPGEEFVKSYRHPEAQLPDEATLHRLVSTELVARTAQSAEPLRVDKARTTPDAAAFCFVSAPLRRGEQKVGVLAAFASLARRPFSVLDAELLTASAAQLVELL
jgi:hypothetical protein